LRVGFEQAILFQEYITAPHKGADHQQAAEEKRHLGDGVVVADQPRFFEDKFPV
jgi:hypothetical protein